MKFNQPSSFYLGIYAGLGVSQTLGFFLMGYCFALLTYYASRDLHRIAIKRVMNAPMSFFETTVCLVTQLLFRHVTHMPCSAPWTYHEPIL